MLPSAVLLQQQGEDEGEGGGQPTGKHLPAGTGVRSGRTLHRAPMPAFAPRLAAAPAPTPPPTGHPLAASPQQPPWVPLGSVPIGGTVDAIGVDPAPAPCGSAWTWSCLCLSRTRRLWLPETPALMQQELNTRQTAETLPPVLARHGELGPSPRSVGPHPSRRLDAHVVEGTEPSLPQAPPTAVPIPAPQHSHRLHRAPPNTALLGRLQHPEPCTYHHGIEFCPQAAGKCVPDPTGSVGWMLPHRRWARGSLVPPRTAGRRAAVPWWDRAQLTRSPFNHWKYFLRAPLCSQPRLHHASNFPSHCSGAGPRHGEWARPGGLLCSPWGTGPSLLGTEERGQGRGAPMGAYLELVTLLPGLPLR